jgi:predicted small metal-binding protein
MADDKSIRCDCGYRLQAGTEERQVAEVRRHAWEAHGISFSTEEALAVLLRLELDVDEGAPAYSATASDTASGKEKG